MEEQMSLQDDDKKTEAGLGACSGLQSINLKKIPFNKQTKIINQVRIALNSLLQGQSLYVPAYYTGQMLVLHCL